MKVMTLTIDDKTISLRLTASKLAAYAAETHATGNTVYSVMDALDDIAKQGKLLTAALTFKDNNNKVKDGFELIDMLADADYEPVQIKELIVTLAVGSGLIGKEDAVKLKDAIHAGSEKLYRIAVAVLSGNTPDISITESDGESKAENPT